MTYRLKLEEPVDKAWRRIAREEIDTAIALLKAGKDRAVSVHETRKAMKRIRALLKLLRTGLTEEVYKRENARYAEIARLLSGTRDTQVLHATAQQLSEVTDGKSRAAALALMEAARGRIDTVTSSGPKTRAGKASPGKPPPVAKAIVALKAARKSIERLKLRTTSFAVVREGLTKSYRRARRAMQRCYKSNHDEDFHEWRKWVQAHWRHMTLVSRAWPDLFAARIVLAKEMSDLLGADHDLYMLIEAARQNGKRGGKGEGRDGLIRAAVEQQENLREQLRTKGAALFAEPADDFVTRVEAYWDAALASRKQQRKDARAARKASKGGDEGKPGRRKAARGTGDGDAPAAQTADGGSARRGKKRAGSS